MINLQMQGYTAVLGSSRWAEQVRPEVLRQRCICCGDRLCLSSREIESDFDVLEPLEADLDGWLLQQIEQLDQSMLEGTQLALIRWKDHTESLVVLNAGDLVPAPQVLADAYWNAGVQSYT